MKYLSIVIVALLTASCLGIASEQSEVDFCPEYGEYFNIQRHENSALTICPIDSPSDCHKDFYLQAYEYQKVDLNNDGLKDYIAVIKSGLVGIDHNLSYYAVYFSCDHERYRRVLFDAFTKIEHIDKPSKDTSILNVTRECYDKTSKKYIVNKYIIKYDSEIKGYGPPNDDERLLDFCGSYELSFENSI